MSETKMPELKPCPFCGGEMEQFNDDYGGAWIEHKEKHKNGGIQKCVLTGVELDISSQVYHDWNTRTHDAEVERLKKELETLKP